MSEKTVGRHSADVVSFVQERDQQDNFESAILTALEEVEAVFRDRTISEELANEIQIRLNETGMSMRAAIAPREIHNGEIKDRG